MKKTFKNIRTLAALLIASAAFSACSNEDSAIIGEQPASEQQAPQVYTLTIDASMDGGAQTRALEFEGTKLVAKWANDETVDVRFGATLLGTLTVSNVSADGKTCTLSGTLTGTINKYDVLRFHYNYTSPVNESQTGTLSSTAGSDYAMAAVTVKSVDGGNITLESEPSFQTQVAVLKITMQDALANKLNATSLNIKIGDKDLCTLSPNATAYSENGDGVVYFALPSAHRVYAEGISSIGLDEEELAAATVTFTATVGGNTYITTKTGYPFAAGKYYATTLTMAKVVDYSSEINVPAGDHWYISGTSEYNNITIGDGATVTIGGHLLMQNASIICSGNATIILADGTDANIFNGRIKAGPENTTLTIKGNTGELNIQAGPSLLGAAIGASDGDVCGNIEIEGGVITAEGAMAAGIGASTAACGHITISGGTVTANGEGGAGIGASTAECGDITISGGTVTATCDDGGGAGIGSGSSDTGWCGNITISGGTVIATGGSKSAGIGTGEDNGCGDITIKSTVTHVTATKGSGAEASIGAAIDGDSYCGTVTIGGVVTGNITESPYTYPEP